jgi:hypothetical protein
MSTRGKSAKDFRIYVPDPLYLKIISLLLYVFINLPYFIRNIKIDTSLASSRNCSFLLAHSLLGLHFQPEEGAV